MIFYVATIVRAVCNERWRQRIAPFTLAGRMPLTNYLLQTLIAVTLFYHWGFGLWGKVGPALDVVLAVAIFFVVQVPLSRWWLSRFQVGPMEYLWRVLTYGPGAMRMNARQRMREGDVMRHPLFERLTARASRSVRTLRRSSACHRTAWGSSPG